MNIFTRGELPRHLSASISVPQQTKRFDFRMENFEAFQDLHGSGQVMFPVIGFAEDVQWVVEVYPRGRNNHNALNVSFIVRNVTDTTLRATCKIWIKCFSNHCLDHIQAGESSVSNVFRPSGAANDQWICDTDIPFDTIVNARSGSLQYLCRGALRFSVQVTNIGLPTGRVHATTDSEQRRSCIRNILTSLKQDLLVHTVRHDLQSQLKGANADNQSATDRNAANWLAKHCWNGLFASMDKDRSHSQDYVLWY